MPLLGEISALATAALWSCSALILSAAATRIGSVGVNVGRLVFALAFLTAAILLFEVSIDMSRSQVFWLALSGVVGLALGDSYLFEAFKTIGPRISMLIMSSAPALAAVAAFLILGEHLSIWGGTGMAVTLAGIALVILVRGRDAAPPATQNARGLLFAFLGAAGQGVSLVFAKLAFNQGEINGFVATTLRILASLVILLPVMGFTGRLTRPFHSLRADRTALALTVAGSVLGPFLGISLSLVSVAHTDVGIAATIMATVPILMLPLVWIVYRERLTVRAIGGAFLAVGGVAILFLR